MNLFNGGYLMRDDGEEEALLSDSLPGTAEEYLAERNAEAAVIKALLEALQEIEWVSDDNELGPWCPWCWNYKRSGHDRSCRREAAIAKAKEEANGR